VTGDGAESPSARWGAPWVGGCGGGDFAGARAALGGSGTESCREKVLFLGFLEVFAQRFVMCLCQRQAGHGELSARHRRAPAPVTGVLPARTPISSSVHTVSPVHAAMLGTHFFLLSATHPSAAASLGGTEMVPTPSTPRSSRGAPAAAVKSICPGCQEG